MTPDPAQLALFETDADGHVMTPAPDLMEGAGSSVGSQIPRVPRMGEPGYQVDIICQAHEGCQIEDHNYYGYPRCEKWSKQQQRRCRQPLIPGTHTCKYHGSGNHAQSLAKAKLRLLSTADDNVSRLILERDYAEKSTDRQRAANSLLDRIDGFYRGGSGGADLREIVVARLMEIRERKELEASGDLDPDSDQDPVDAEIIGEADE